MKLITATESLVLPLGRLGENEYTKIRFDVSGWFSEYPDAVIGLYNQRPNDSEAYPVAGIETAGGLAIWTVTSADLTQKGNGRCQLVATSNGVVVKSAIYCTAIFDALGTDGATPEPWDEWQEQFVTLKDEAETAAQNAETAVTHYPRIVNKVWEVWDAVQGAYVSTGVVAEGKDGENGEDGVSPVITVTDISGGHRVTITDASGTSTFDVLNGENGTNGTNGQDGYSPTVTVTDITGGHRLTITDKNGTQTVDVLNGTNGTNGTDGTNAYVYIRYSAAEPTQDSDMKTAPDAWMGIYSGDASTAPTAYTAYTWYKIKGETGASGGVSDVQVNGTSVVTSGVANVPVAGVDVLGVVKIPTNNNYNFGIAINESGQLYITPSAASQVKAGTNGYRPITPSIQDAAAFYGFAKAAGDTTQSSSSNTVGTYTSSAKNAIKAMLGITQTITVTAVTQDNVTVTGQTVYLREDDASGPIYAQAAYEGQPVSFAVPSGFHYHISISDTLAHHFNPSTASGIMQDASIAVTLTYSDFSSIHTAADIKAALDANLDLTDLVGESITCTRGTDTLTWDVVDYDSTNKRVTLLLHDCFGTANMVFEPVQALMWCENGLAAGSYTFKWNTTQCYFTLTQAIPAGGQLRATNTTFSTYESQSATATLETGMVDTTAITGATDLGTTGTGLLNHHDRVNYGSNNYIESALFWWLNSDAAANTQRTPVTKFSRAYSYNVAGFLNGLDADFIAAIDNAIWKCSTNNVYECPASLGGVTAGKQQAYTVTAKIGLASEMEIFGSYSGTADGSTVYDLYNGATADDRKKYRGTTAQTWWLRSPSWILAYYERCVTSSGGANSSTAYYSCAVVPACQISRSVT